MAQYNAFFLAGFAGGDADFRQAGQSNVASFSLCFTEKGNEQREDQPHWFKVEAWGGWSDTGKLVKKGDNVVVQGRLFIRKWQGEDGTERTTPTIIVEKDLHIVERRDGGGDGARPATSTRPQQQRRSTSFGQKPKQTPIDEYPF